MVDPRLIVRAEGLAFAYPGQPLLSGLSLAIGPGLTLVRGGDGRGKTTLLRLLAGALEPAAGSVRRLAETVFWEQPAAPAHDALKACTWLEARRAQFAHWDAGLAGRLSLAFGLGEHLDKPLYMLSAGSRRKVGLVAAAASAAQLTLLDMPFAALDAPSSRVLVGLLSQAAASPDRAWVVADYALPAGLAGVALSGLVDLGD